MTTTEIPTDPHELALVPGEIITDAVIGDRAPWSGVVAAGDVLTIVDLYGNQAVDTLFYGGHDHTVRYSAQATIAAQGNIFLTTGTVIRDQESNALMTIVDDEAARVFGAAFAEASAAGDAPAVAFSKAATKGIGLATVRVQV